MKASAQETDGASLRELLRRHLADPASSWSCGGFGAIAEFAWDAGEAIRFGEGDEVSAATNRGAIRIVPQPGLRAIAYELGGRDADSWQHGVAFCLNEIEAVMAQRSTVTELGPDKEAVRPEDRDAILFDLGLTTPQADICVRAAAPETIRRLREATGKPFAEAMRTVLAELPRLSPHRVFCCRFGRIEVFQAIPPADGTSPEGPHTHVLPQLLAQRRTHAANLPLPAGWVPAMTLYPPSPIRTLVGQRKPFDRSEFEAFQALWERYGDPELVALKKTILPALVSGTAPPEPEEASRAARSVLRVAARQAQHLIAAGG